MLNYTVTYRCVDKKPYDNNLKEPAITQLAKSSFELLGGDSITKGIKNTTSADATLSFAATSTLEKRGAISAFMVEPTGLGKVLCPSVR